MRHWNRALTALAAAAAGGFLLWFAPHFHALTTGGYWGVMALMAVAGVLIGLSQLRGRDGNSTASYLVALVPVLAAAGWVILAAQPRGDWIRSRVLSWSADMKIEHAVHNLGEHVAVIAFALGVIVGVTFEPKRVRRRRDETNVTRYQPPSTPPDRVEDRPESDTEVVIGLERS